MKSSVILWKFTQLNDNIFLFWMFQNDLSHPFLCFPEDNFPGTDFKWHKLFNVHYNQNLEVLEFSEV